jgi:formylglycine-generating enzyme required for sulfatase activity
MLNGADQSAKRIYPSWPCFDFDDGYVYTAPVGSFKANGFGLHDMHGNVWEWCEDYFGETYYSNSPRRNPRGPSTGTYRMSRGGSWDYYDSLYRSAVRVRLSPEKTYCGQGFRVVCGSTVMPESGEPRALPPLK